MNWSDRSLRVVGLVVLGVPVLVAGGVLVFRLRESLDQETMGAPGLPVYWLLLPVPVIISLWLIIETGVLTYAATRPANRDRWLALSLKAALWGGLAGVMLGVALALMAGSAWLLPAGVPAGLCIAFASFLGVASSAWNSRRIRARLAAYRHQTQSNSQTRNG
jgi:hypothetical protein